MTVTLKVNARNDLHLPSELLRRLNLGPARLVKVEQRHNALLLVPVDLEPRYAQEELEGLDRLHEDQRKAGWIPLESPQAIEALLTRRRQS